MTDLQKLEVAIRDKKEELRALGLKEDPTEEENAKFDSGMAELGGMEKRFANLKLLEDEKPKPAGEGEKPEDIEKRQLIEKFNVGEVFRAAYEHRGKLDGAEGELQSEYGLPSNMVPFAVFEKRAVTPAPANVERAEAEVVLPIFADSVAGFLGITMPNPQSGDASYPVLETRPTVGGPHSDSTSVSETTGTFSAESLSPERLQATFFYRRNDAVKFPGMGDALRSALRMGLTEALDKEVLVGSVNGLLTGTNLDNNNSSALATYAEYVSSAGYSRVDGRYVSNASQLRIVFGSSTYAHAGGVYRANEADRSALDRLMAITGGVRVSAHVLAVASKKQLSVVRLGSEPGAVLPVWGSGVGLIVDEITKSDTGEIKVTAYVMMNFKVTRKAVFHKQQFQVAA